MTSDRVANHFARVRVECGRRLSASGLEMHVQPSKNLLPSIANMRRRICAAVALATVANEADALAKSVEPGEDLLRLRQRT